MALRFLADHCISNWFIRMLRDAGHEVLRLRDVLPVDSPDPLVIGKAQEIGALLVSLNGDFADIVTYPPRQYQGIIALQMRNHPEILPQLWSRLNGYIELHPRMADYKGKLLVIEPDRIRIRE